MRNLLALGAAWHRAQRTTWCSTLVTYERPGVGSCELLAERGRSLFELERDDGFAEQTKTFDWQIAPADLLVTAEPTRPEVGDLIHETTATDTLTYQALSLSGEPPWRWTSAYRERIRLHTKLIRTVPHAP